MNVTQVLVTIGIAAVVAAIMIWTNNQGYFPGSLHNMTPAEAEAQAAKVLALANANK